MLYVNELYKTFADDNSTVNALQDINMHIKPNEFAVIVGPKMCIRDRQHGEGVFHYMMNHGMYNPQ